MHVIQPQADQHSIIERLKATIRFRQFVGGGDQQPHRDGLFAVTIAEAAFIDSGQQGIQNRRAGFPDLIQKNNLGVGQIPFSETLVASFVFQCLNGERAKHFFRRGETGHQIFKGAGVLKGIFKAAGNQALGDARRAKQKHAFTAQRGQQAKANGMVPFI